MERIPYFSDAKAEIKEDVGRDNEEDGFVLLVEDELELESGKKKFREPGG